MSNKLVDQFANSITTYVNSTTQTNAQPLIGVIEQTSDNLNYCSVRVDQGLMTQVPCHGIPKIGTSAVIIFIQGNYDQPVAICNPLNCIDKSLVEEYTTYGTYNVHSNGDFNKDKTGYSGTFTISTKESWTDEQGKSAQLKPNQTLIFNEKLSSLTEPYFKLQAFYKGNSKLKIQVLDTDKQTLLKNKPTSLNYSTCYWQGNNTGWMANKEIYDRVSNIQVTLTNVGTNTMFIDGILIYNESTDMHYYNSKQDVLT